MRTPANFITAASTVAALLTALAVPPTLAATTNESEQTLIEQGKEIAFSTKKGNCLACHEIAGGELPGNIGPALVGMKARYPDKDKLRMQIFDATKNNPNTIMPPFGRNAILTDDELNKVVEFIYSR